MYAGTDNIGTRTAESAVESLYAIGFKPGTIRIVNTDLLNPLLAIDLEFKANSTDIKHVLENSFQQHDIDIRVRVRNNPAKAAPASTSAPVEGHGAKLKARARENLVDMLQAPTTKCTLFLTAEGGEKLAALGASSLNGILHNLSNLSAKPFARTA